jgi:hypothetical protein
MFEDEASFGRISEPSYCWCPSGIRPAVPCQRVREYVYVYGPSDPIDGEFFSIIAPKCKTDWMNVFLLELSKEVRKSGLKNALFKTLDKVVGKLCDILPNIPKSIVKNITGREWISSMYSEK